MTGTLGCFLAIWRYPFPGDGDDTRRPLLPMLEAPSQGCWRRG